MTKLEAERQYVKGLNDGSFTEARNNRAIREAALREAATCIDAGRIDWGDSVLNVKQALKQTILALIDKEKPRA